MSGISRRNFIQITGGAAAVSTMGFSNIILAGKSAGHVVIIGGGVGGATAARYIKRADPAVQVTIVEPNANYFTCFMSNEVISGERPLDSIKFGYKNLESMGIKVVQDYASNIDAKKKHVVTKKSGNIAYDRCIVSPGVDFKWEMIEGYDAGVAANKIPHAWKAGPQTALLHKQLQSMKDGGTVIIAPPPNPFRCPPGPYERACQIAHYLKNNKPKSKILILDAKDKFSKQGLFTQGWKKHYGYGTDNSLIEWVKGAEGGIIEGVDAKTNTVTGSVEEYKGDVINIIPAQKAGKIAFNAGLVNDKGWCPVNQQTFESTMHKDVYVIGDSSVASPLPKSGYSANSEAKVCAAAVVASLHGKPAGIPTLVNTCYSLITPDDGISVAMVYNFDGKKIQKVKGSGGLTPMDSSEAMRKREARYAHSWFNNITNDIFGG
ncbi:MAG: NAD(P)/FAD-dependent oxidoreductase [gamma proteobacterium symbiont of Bathyaustriella thionipta]|nr:NAD(P)/FAD-dependent oxidoreductase [gamma proteobacterium symbiont of Bathyaustriella thionipta]MCU7950804.1 NAD(P)/FAD-dependent oxidoreductase [gamma proteobacterium symbiont of Bathyaustriella thionipta]MCU7952353.1 NAD(P)/FAD-dependent oxidoreductase [gamma proteobacterium symbiont of Bathyaustriella thionipta]MCU7957316.1 NAD(P)/FAD-dependent oxidoreductase [gamma proteobacterium symbiont of Bathyaustriella thionipta]MCU7966421.1 NAD(P)/FAD-dependent oxidoreductase [gamma proteobacteri